MKCYAVFDTNVLVSSLLTKRTDTATAMVVDAISIGDVIPLYNQEILKEYREVLQRDKFPFSELSVQRILKMIRDFGIEVFPSPTGKILPDMTDLVFYEVVMEKRGRWSLSDHGKYQAFSKRRIHCNACGNDGNFK